MNKAIILTSLLVTFVPLSFAFAQDKTMTVTELEYKLKSIKNPFQSQLPVKIVEPEIEETPVAQKEPGAPQDGSTPPVQAQKEVEPEIPLPQLSVSGVIWNSNRPQAIINNKIVDIGDKILDVEITDIQKTTIEGRFHGRTVSIKTQRSEL